MRTGATLYDQLLSPFTRPLTQAGEASQAVAANTRVIAYAAAAVAAIFVVTKLLEVARR